MGHLCSLYGQVSPLVEFFPILSCTHNFSFYSSLLWLLGALTFLIIFNPFDINGFLKLLRRRPKGSNSRKKFDQKVTMSEDIQSQANLPATPPASPSSAVASPRTTPRFSNKSLGSLRTSERVTTSSNDSVFTDSPQLCTGKR